MDEARWRKAWDLKVFGPEEYAAKIRSDLAKWSKLIRAADIKPQ